MKEIIKQSKSSTGGLQTSYLRDLDEGTDLIRLVPQIHLPATVHLASYLI